MLSRYKLRRRAWQFIKRSLIDWPHGWFASVVLIYVGIVIAYLLIGEALGDGTATTERECTYVPPTVQWETSRGIHCMAWALHDGTFYYQCSDHTDGVADNTALFHQSTRYVFSIQE